MQGHLQQHCELKTTQTTVNLASKKISELIFGKTVPGTCKSTIRSDDMGPAHSEQGEHSMLIVLKAKKTLDMLKFSTFIALLKKTCPRKMKQFTEGYAKEMLTGFPFC